MMRCYATEPLTRQEREDLKWLAKRDRLVGQLMDVWQQEHVTARDLLTNECPELVAALDALYAHADAVK